MVMTRKNRRKHSRPASAHAMDIQMPHSTSQITLRMVFIAPPRAFSPHPALAPGYQGGPGGPAGDRRRAGGPGPPTVPRPAPRVQIVAFPGLTEVNRSGPADVIDVSPARGAAQA